MRIAGMLESEGMTRAESVDDADVVVLNTCCIRENADNKLYGNLGNLRALKQQRPEMRIVVAGCLAQKDKELVAVKASHVDVVVGTFNTSRIVELLSRSNGKSPEVEVWDGPPPDDHFPSLLAPKRESSHSAWVTIQVGCDNNCAFCIVPSVRGAEVSRPFFEIIEELEQLVRTGVSEVTLLGQNVNSYGRDLAVAARNGTLNGELEKIVGTAWLSEGKLRPRPLFADLLRVAGEIPGLKRIRFTSPHPKDLRPETINAMAEIPSVCEQLHLPLQSGSDGVLSAMHRGYTAERYLEKVAMARAAISDVAISTDIIVGFPGESEEDFQRTLEVASEVSYDSAFTFVFSPRSGTEAAAKQDKFIDPGVVVERYERLKVVIDRSALLHNRERVGRLEEVLVDGPSKKNPALWSGRTRQNKLVHFVPPHEGEATGFGVGAYVSCSIQEAFAHHLRGEVVGVLSPPSSRRRLILNSR